VKKCLCGSGSLFTKRHTEESEYVESSLLLPGVYDHIVVLTTIKQNHAKSVHTACRVCVRVYIY
jgi:hypothetical protein